MTWDQSDTGYSQELLKDNCQTCSYSPEDGKYTGVTQSGLP